MKALLEMTLLYDFYGELLTEKQKCTFSLFYQNDLSLSEIGEELDISRQAVRDQLKRTEKILLSYEEKLCLVERFLAEQKLVKKMKETAEELEKIPELPKEAKEKIFMMKEIAKKILE